MIGTNIVSDYKFDEFESKVLWALFSYDGVNMNSQIEGSTLVNDAFERCNEIFKQKFKDSDLTAENTLRLNFKEFDSFSGETYEVYYERHKKDKYFSTNVNDPIYTIRKSFQTLHMSPGLKDDHLLTYVIDKEGERPKDIGKFLEVHKHIYINENKKLLTAIYNFWVNKSIKLLKTHSSRLSEAEHDNFRRLCKYLIVGPPGIGKTSLLNYLFSVKAKELVDKKVLWIRVDLNHIESMYLRLRERLNSKFLRIFCKFYLFQDSYPEFDKIFFNDLQKYLSDYAFSSKKFLMLKDSQKSDLIFSFSKVMLSLIDSTHKELDNIVEFRNFEIDKNDAAYLVDEVITYIQKNCNYSYLFMFDGLDSVTIDLIQYEIFDGWLQEMWGVANNYDKPYRAVYIVTMRDYSFIKYQQNIRRISSKQPGSPHQFKELKMKAQDTRGIMDNKVLLLHNNLKKAGFVFDIDRVKNIKTNLYNLIFMCLNKLNPKDVLKYESKDIFNSIDGLFEYNYRSLMRFFRELVPVVCDAFQKDAVYKIMQNSKATSFLDSLVGREWTIFRLLLYGDIGYGVYANRIQYQDGEPQIENYNRAVVPNIFNYNEQKDSPSFPKTLVKIRILQYLLKNNDSDINDILNWLSNSIDNRWDIISLRYETREMIYSGLISPKVDLIRITKGGDALSYDVRLNGFSEIVLKMLNESIYYETVIDDTPIDKRFSYKMEPRNVFDNSITRKDYIFRKTRSVIFFLLYLQKIEANEKKLIIENKGVTKGEYERYFEMTTEN